MTSRRFSPSVSLSLFAALTAALLHSNHALAACQMQRESVPVADPVQAGQWLTVHALHFVPSEKARVENAGFLIYPSVAGTSPLEYLLAREACKRGLDAVILDTWTNPDHGSLEFTTHEHGFQRGLAVGQAVSTAFGYERIFVAGMSLGGMYSSIFAGSDERAIGALIVAGGGPTDEVILNSNLVALQKLRKARKEAFGIDDAAYARLIHENVHMQTTDVVRPELRDGIFFIMADIDVTVPTINQQKLWEAWGRPEITHLQKGHFGTLVYAGLNMRRQIVDFAVSRFEER